MDYKLFSLICFSIMMSGSCSNLENNQNSSSVIEGSLRKGRAVSSLVYANLLTCAVRYDASCFVDAAGEYFEDRKNDLLAQADLEALRATGRADPENTPSQLAKTIEKLLSDLSGLFKEGLINFFSAREGEDEDKLEGSDNNSNDGTNRGVNGEMRKKKKKPIKSLIALIKIAILAAIIGGKILVLVKVFEAALKFKFLLVAVGGLLINGFRFWFDLKGNKQQQHHEENIVYRNPYEHGGDWSSPGGPGEYNARAYDLLNTFSQNMAYSGQKPTN